MKVLKRQHAARVGGVPARLPVPIRHRKRALRIRAEQNLRRQIHSHDNSIAAEPNSAWKTQRLHKVIHIVELAEVDLEPFVVLVPPLEVEQEGNGFWVEAIPDEFC